MTLLDDLFGDDSDLEDDLDDLDDLDEGGSMGLFDDDDDDDEDFDDDDDPSGDDVDRSVFVHCPYCGQEVEHVVDPGGGSIQTYVEDCEVCCQPWEVTVRIEGGIPWATAKALDE